MKNKQLYYEVAIIWGKIKSPTDDDVLEFFEDKFKTLTEIEQKDIIDYLVCNSD